MTSKYEVLGDPVDIVYWNFQKALTISFKKGHWTIMGEDGKFCLKGIGTCNNLGLNGLLETILSNILLKVMPANSLKKVSWGHEQSNFGYSEGQKSHKLFG